MGGGPTLFGIASIINHISELLAYFFSNKILLKFGYAKILYIGLCGNVLRFLYISVIAYPWWALPVEIIQGMNWSTNRLGLVGVQRQSFDFSLFSSHVHATL